MSRYVIWTEDENLEVTVGFDEGFERFFLTIADARTCTGESGSYLFNNIDHHPGVGMALEQVAATLERFGMAMPPDLSQQLAADARRFGAMTPAVLGVSSMGTTAFQSGDAPIAVKVTFRTGVRVLSWQSTL